MPWHSAADGFSPPCVSPKERAGAHAKGRVMGALLVGAARRRRDARADGGGDAQPLPLRRRGERSPPSRDADRLLRAGHGVVGSGVLRADKAQGPTTQNVIRSGNIFSRVSAGIVSSINGGNMRSF